MNSHFRVFFYGMAIVLLAAGLSCKFLSAGTTPSNPTDQNAPPAATVTPAPVPAGWKLSKDASGSCQVATPPDWQLGSDFFLKAEKPDPGPFADKPGQFPPMGAALWGTDAATPLPDSHRFQMRTSLVTGNSVCSVWRIKQDTDFTDAEKSEMEQVGKTLQQVQ